MSKIFYKRISLFLMILISIAIAPTLFSAIILIFASLFVENYYEGIPLALIFDGSKNFGEHYEIFILMTIIISFCLIISRRLKILLK